MMQSFILHNQHLVSCRPELSSVLIFCGMFQKACGETEQKSYKSGRGPVTSLATMSSLMRMKSIFWWAAMPSALWMLCRSAAMSGRVDDSAQRWLHRTHTVSRARNTRHTMTTCQSQLSSEWNFAQKNKSILHDGGEYSPHTCPGVWAACSHGSWDTGFQTLPLLLILAQGLHVEQKNRLDETQNGINNTHIWIFTLPFCFCWKSPATRHLADSMVLTMLVERTLKMEKIGRGRQPVRK